MNIRSISLLIAVAPFAAQAAPKTFTIISEGLSYRNVATVESESEFETFTGKTNAVTGVITFDPVKKTGAGTVSINPATIDTGIAARNEHMRGSMWLETDKYPAIKFVTTQVRNTGGDNYQVTGSFSLHGVTKTIKATARVRYRAEGEATKAAGFEGDVLQLSTRFTVKLSDYGIVIPSMAKGKVSNEVTISVSTYALSK
jgi:polyisoprenoid-binding protein YceI